MNPRSLEGRRRRAPRGSGEQLRDEILDAATDLLLETGSVKDVSIRSVAERVGVTPPSIYLHFTDKDALLDAVCARYYESLHAKMKQAADGQSTTLDVLRAQGLAYVRFAIDTPELYRIATMGEGRPGSDVDATLASSAFMHLRETVQTLMDEGIYPPGDPTAVTLQLWSTAHGIAALLVAKPYLPFGDPLDFADNVMRAFCTGQIVIGIIGAEATVQDTLDWVLENKGVRQ
ncbi:TetR/AcrR family transcriptional regulator [Mycobacterium sp. ACS4331]|uniref:TetR/AcrR family transcriptional regulator n=1 Tax=Mycobacterium sp. ACS4331 TaxID=1834121 RepID=UPI0007FCCC18|nr:TetR/AcrR family transcriptional regulator [Mycobacterium sp. ACS4331]OBF14503.1 TetR family transcriptional regulator [Mycobacterium sp. ACS4331]